MEASQIYILLSIAVLLITALILFKIKKGKKQKRLSKLAALAFVFVISGIAFGDSRLIGYTLMGIGVFLALIDIFNKMTYSQIKSS